MGRISGIHLERHKEERRGIQRHAEVRAMNLDTDRIEMAARSLCRLELAGSITVDVVDTPVDAVSGSPAQVEPAKLNGRSAREVASILLRCYAGDTVFIVRSPDESYLVRPPFSEVLVFYRQRPSGVVAWSGIYLPDEIAADTGEWDREYLGGSLLNPGWITNRTGFRQIKELLSGGILSVTDTTVHNYDAMPELVRDVRPNRSLSFDEATRLVRDQISNSVAHKTVYGELGFSIASSGGLDSSVVAVAAAKIYPESPIHLMNTWRNDDPRSDERIYFAALADSIVSISDYIETAHGASRTDLSPDLFLPSPRPSKMVVAGPLNAKIHRTAEAHGSQVILSGDGGDQLFLRVTRSILTEQLIREARNPIDKAKAVIGVAIQQHESLWTTLLDAWSGAGRKHFTENVLGAHAFKPVPITGRSLGSVPRQPAPGLREIVREDISRGFQYAGLRIAEFNRIPLAGTSVYERKPYVFWPLIRLSLQIPRSVHCHAGRDRAVERAVFADTLPPEIARRMGKGGGGIATRFDYRQFARNLIGSELCTFGLLEQDSLLELSQSDAIDDETVFTLIRAQATKEWMDRCAAGQ
ncbi:asparagine synthase-related protein [Nocardia sp. NPDC046473]|uniref:asparagine synthase-related protein n=1 Tax=Nocardia sp. NPDC046473 TaxID=3155733 RepID=UPI0033C9A373